MLIFLFLLLFPLKINALTASSYIVMDQTTKRVYEGKNINEPRLIASITKIMTAVIAIENADLNAQVTINDSILKAYGSGIYIQIGEKLTLKELLYGLLLRSGNDAALAIANYVTGDVSSFVFLMNKKASELGMNNTTFKNPTGLEENDKSGNTSTVFDMALLTQYALRNETYKKIVSTKEITVKSSLKTYKWTNKNKLLHSYEYCTGGKTGYTRLAKRTLITHATKDDKNLIVITFNDGDDFNDHKKLYEKYFEELTYTKLITKDTTFEDKYYIKDDYYLLLKPSDIVKQEIVTLPNNNNQVAGYIDIFVNAEEIDKIPLYQKQEEISSTKGFFTYIKELLGWLYD